MCEIGADVYQLHAYVLDGWAVITTVKGRESIPRTNPEPEWELDSQQFWILTGISPIMREDVLLEVNVKWMPK